MMRFAVHFSCATLLASAALARVPEARRDAPFVDAVQREFVAPYAAWQAERGEFSRADLPPGELRVRVLGGPVRDSHGAEFVRFAVDSRHRAGDWTQARMTGCVYAGTSAVYVKRGEALIAAAQYFAQEAARADASLCQASDARVSGHGPDEAPGAR